jgi:hypothetical protein
MLCRARKELFDVDGEVELVCDRQDDHEFHLDLLQRLYWKDVEDTEVMAGVGIMPLRPLHAAA